MFDQHSFNPTSYSTSTSTHLHLKTQPILVWFDSRNPTWGISGMRSVPEFTWDFRESMLSLSLDNSRPSFLRLEFSTLTKSTFASPSSSCLRIEGLPFNDADSSCLCLCTFDPTTASSTHCIVFWVSAPRRAGTQH
ncbi:hypothetical protein B0H16DRAFT_1730357 [Mycena metata]|uniref:Uncharacterized protein n=1 Tax=Mycena metata TaxID=1033252 RepID=A0AAD7I8A0_9AGAR|nr:hypothetical protein B0H16DRAFT_1730357 [Mycena metata]